MDVFSPVLCVFLYVAVVSTEKVPVPDRVRISSQDLSLFLEWDPPLNSSSQTFNYTSELIRKYSGNEQVCPSSPALSCDFTESVSVFGRYNLRVRAEQNGSVSEWVQTKIFSLDEITIISAPQVKLLSRKGQIQVEITDPPLRQRVLKEVASGVSYFIRYWKKDAAEESNVTREQNVVWLDLEPAVDYCVQVTILCFNRQSITSNTTCLTNSTNDDASPWFIAAMVLVGFLVAVVVVLLLFLLGWSGYKGFRILNPDTELPEHLKRCLAQAPQSSVFWAMQNCPQPNEQFHQVQILIRDQENDEAHQRTGTDKSEQAAPHTGNTPNKCLL